MYWPLGQTEGGAIIGIFYSSSTRCYLSTYKVQVYVHVQDDHRSSRYRYTCICAGMLHSCPPPPPPQPSLTHCTCTHVHVCVHMYHLLAYIYSPSRVCVYTCCHGFDTGLRQLIFFSGTKELSSGVVALCCLVSMTQFICTVC